MQYLLKKNVKKIALQFKSNINNNYHALLHDNFKSFFVDVLLIIKCKVVI